MTSKTVLSSENPVFASFAFYTCVLILKMILVQMSTTFERMTRKVFANPEDMMLGGDPTGKKDLKVNLSDAAVERTRRSHLNDIENIIPFILIGLLYVTTLPKLSTAVLLFRIFTGSRIVYSVAYMFGIPQPTRTTAFSVALGVNVFMLANTLMFYYRV